jgi:hypothetical protein
MGGSESKSSEVTGSVNTLVTIDNEEIGIADFHIVIILLIIITIIQIISLAAKVEKYYKSKVKKRLMLNMNMSRA